MKIFNKIFGLTNPSKELVDKNEKNQPESALLPIEKAFCPYCKNEFPKKPDRKTKCKNCNNFIFVRTHPKSKKRIICTEEEANRIDAERSLISDNPFDEKRNWGTLNKELTDNVKNDNWGLYRNVVLEMGYLLLSENKYDAALDRFIEIVYLDLNGPNNIGGCDIKIREELKLKRFDLELSFLAPAIIEKVVDLVDYLGIPNEKFKEIYLNKCLDLEKNLKLPFSAEKSWEKIESYFQDFML